LWRPEALSFNEEIAFRRRWAQSWTSRPVDGRPPALPDVEVNPWDIHDHPVHLWHDPGLPKGAMISHHHLLLR